MPEKEPQDDYFVTKKLNWGCVKFTEKEAQSSNAAIVSLFLLQI